MGKMAEAKIIQYLLVVCSNQNKECIDVKNLEEKVSDISSMLEDWIY